MTSSKKPISEQKSKITGHEWNGITEFNTPIPKIIWISLIVTTIIAITMWILYPTWPVGNTYTRGVLKIDQKTDVTKNLVRSKQTRAYWEAKFLASTLSDIQMDPKMMVIVRQNGRRLFDDNCAMCHGSTAQGGDGYPSLIDGQWLWGGDIETIMETINVGVNNGSEDARFSQMLAFGQDEILNLEERNQVVSYVQSLSQHASNTKFDPASILAGAEIFSENCASCHGGEAKGDQSAGAPNLTDDFWLYGGDRASIAHTVNYGRQGVMPHWSGRLSLSQRKTLALYIYDLGEKTNEEF